MKKTILLSFLCILIISPAAADPVLKLKDSTNVLIYQNTYRDSFLLLQLVTKSEEMVHVKSCEIKCHISDLKLRKFSTLDSIISERKVFKGIEPDYSSLKVDTLEIIYDSVFFAHNSVYSYVNETYYVKFNALKIKDPGSIHDLSDIFIMETSKDKTMVKFWSNDIPPFSFQTYIFKRGFWFIVFCSDDNYYGSFVISSINGIKKDTDSMGIKGMFNTSVIKKQ